MTQTKILVIDDDIPVCRSICKALASSCYIVDSAFSGEEGFEMLKKKAYDIIIVDLMMPGMTGLQFLETLKQKNTVIRVIIITGYPSAETAVKSIKMGAVDYLAKPFTPDEIRNLVNKKG